jgi:hypothetical protein
MPHHGQNYVLQDRLDHDASDTLSLLMSYFPAACTTVCILLGLYFTLAKIWNKYALPALRQDILAPPDEDKAAKKVLYKSVKAISEYAKTKDAKGQASQ